MLKKLLKTHSDEIFPIQKSIVNDVAKSSDGTSQIKSVADISRWLMDNGSFMRELTIAVAKEVLETLVEKYNFQPTETYVEEMENKKKYINQLDEYLKERKDINKTVENDLQEFLNETTNSLSKALESFSQNINARIRDAENRYGIDAIKNVLLTEKE